MLPKPIDPCSTCPLSGSMQGFVPPSGTGTSGVLIVAEAAGAQEEQEGMGFVGKSGYYLFQNLARIGIDREGFRLANVVSCKPPSNKLAFMPYEESAISTCSPLLDAEIVHMQGVAKANQKTFVILTLGRIAFKRIMGLKERDPILTHDYLNYPFWNEKYQAFVIASYHPSYLMRGNNHLLPVLQFAFKRALEIAEKGLVYAKPEYLLDPNSSTFSSWVEGYKSHLASHPDTLLSYDIETPFKRGKDEEKVDKEEDDDYTILRVSFSYEENRGISIPWQAQYKPYLEHLFATATKLVGWNNLGYDTMRVRHQMPILGEELDAMQMWHVLNTAMPKGLAFVTPFYAQDVPAWKHLSDSSPALYNAIDSDVTLRNANGIIRDLKANGLWEVYERHVVKLNTVLSYMSGKGVLLDQVKRKEAEERVSTLLDGVEHAMEESIPAEVRRLKIYKKTPKDTSGLVEVERVLPVKHCPVCGLVNPKKAHFKAVSAKKAKAGLDNVCEDLTPIVVQEVVKLWAKPLEWKVSKVGLTSYQKALKHAAILSRREHKITFDEPALMKLIKKYPKDKLYPLILDHRKYQKLLSTYIGVEGVGGRVHGGMPVDMDGRIRTTYTHNPSTLRLASQSPNLQNCPRPAGKDDVETLVRNLIVAGEGNVFIARDYSGIEAVLCGYYASAPNYIRLAKMDVHSFYTAYALNELDGRISGNDLPLVSWDDEKLRSRLAEIKKEFKWDRNTLYKHLVHGNNFMQGPGGTQAKIFAETGMEFPLSQIKKVMEVYFSLFPEIRIWHKSLLLQAEKDGFLRNAFGYVHRFNKPFEYEKIAGRWEKRPGPDANKVVAYLPQSTAAGIIKEAMLRLYYERYEESGQFLRLQVHDEILSETPLELAQKVDLIVKEEMEKPILELPLPTSYGMGSYLIIDTEAKTPHKRWGSM